MKDPTKFGFDPDKMYVNLSNNEPLSGDAANNLLSLAPNPEMEAIILLSIVAQLHNKAIPAELGSSANSNGRGKFAIMSN